MAQYDFDLLTIYTTPEVLTQHNDGTQNPGPSEATNVYAAIGFIQNADSTIIIEREQSQKLEQHDIMDDSGSQCISGVLSAANISSLSLEHYEPVRLCTLAAPPKRFYRTFWRSVARRLLERER